MHQGPLHASSLEYQLVVLVGLHFYSASLTLVLVDGVPFDEYMYVLLLASTTYM